MLGVFGFRGTAPGPTNGHVLPDLLPRSAGGSWSRAQDGVDQANRAVLTASRQGLFPPFAARFRQTHPPRVPRAGSADGHKGIPATVVTGIPLSAVYCHPDFGFEDRAGSYRGRVRGKTSNGAMPNAD
jgi:hypothetical protein